MALGIGGILGGVASLGGLMSSLFGGGGDESEAIRDAANQQAAAAMYAQNIADMMWKTTRSDLSPWRTGGTNALLAYMDLLGLPRPDPRQIAPALYQNNTPEMVKYLLETGKTPEGWTNVDNANDLLAMVRPYYETPKYDPTSLLQNTPGYQFRLKEGMNALNRSAAAKGMALSGANVKGALEYGQGLASEEYQKLLDRISGVQQQGQNAAVQTGTFGQNAAGMMGNAAMAGAQAQAQGLYNAANYRNSGYNSMWPAIGYGAGQIGNALNYFFNPNTASSGVRLPVSPGIEDMYL